MIKIGFIVISTLEEPWASINKAGQECTWVSNLGPQDKYIAAYSSGQLGLSWISAHDHRKIEYSNRYSRVHCLSSPKFFDTNHATFDGVKGYGSVVGTTLSAFKFLIEEGGCDYIVRTNVSSYWNVELLRSYLENQPRTLFYAGSSGKLHRKFRGLFSTKEYGSGAGFIVSPDIAKRMIDLRNEIPVNYVDDMAFGKLLTKKRVPLKPISRVDLDSVHALSRIEDAQLKDCFHFRCKSYLNTDKPELRGDISIMKELHFRLNRIQASDR